MAEWIMEEHTDMDGVDCYIRTGRVTRCKDCKYWQYDFLAGVGWCDGKKRKPDFYCADGEGENSHDGNMPIRM